MIRPFKKPRKDVFIEKARLVHGDIYDYSMVDYDGADKAVQIVCKLHGPFWQVSSNHLRGYGCNACYFDSVREKAIKKFLEKSKSVHEGRGYDYSLVDYKNIDSHVDIVCPVHGVFKQTPYRHMQGVGCQKCSGPKYRKLIEHGQKTRLTKEEFVEKSRIKHGDNYDYSFVEYENNRVKVKIVCPVHGGFYQPPTTRMRGVGCPKCKFAKTTPLLKKAARERSKKLAKTFVDRMKIKHAGKGYDYSEAVYKSWDTKVKVICEKHGPFFVSAANHRAGTGCPSCSNIGFDPNKPAILYYLRVFDSGIGEPVYKIGISNQIAKERYPLKSDRQKITILKIWEYPLGREAHSMERKILSLYCGSKYFGEAPLIGVGISEIFYEDVLGLDCGGV